MKNFKTLASAALASAALASATEIKAQGGAPEPHVTTMAEGVRIQVGKGGYTVGYPVFLTEGGDKPEFKPLEVKHDGASARLKYQDGASAAVEVKGGGLVEISFSGVPAAWKRIRLGAMLGFSLADGGFFMADGGVKTRFPAAKPASPILYQGAPKVFTLISGDGTRADFEFPQFSFLQLQDNREWNGWKMHELRATAPYSRDWKTYRLRMRSGSDAAAAAAPKWRVDALGQNAAAAWPQKVASVAELKADAAAEGAYYASLIPAGAPALNSYGGLAGSGEKFGLAKTGFFHVEKLRAAPFAGKWVMVDPEGDVFFHLGVCSFMPYQSATKVEGREEIYEWLPPRTGEFATAWGDKHQSTRDQFNFHIANQIRKYGAPYTPAAWASRFIGRVRAIGFNSAGAFGAPDKSAREAENFPYTSNLPLSKWGAGMREIDREIMDPFDEGNRARVARNFQALTNNADDKLLIGYFVANEPLYENLPAKIPALDASWGCKAELVRMLGEKYGGIAEFRAAWGVDGVESFEQLLGTALPVKTPQASRDMAEYMERFHREFLSLVCGAARKYDPNHMIIGTRLQHGTFNNEAYCRAMGEFFDVISFNYYTYGFDMGFLRKVMAWAGDKPMIFSEFYWDSPSDSGLPGGVKDVASQRERGLAYRHYVENAAAMPWLVGVQWYTLLDTHYTGVGFAGYGGWNANEGLFDATDRPWKDAVGLMAQSNHSVYDVLLGKRAPFAWDDPRFTMEGGGMKTLKASRAPGAITVDGRSDDWPGVPAEALGAARQVDGAGAPFDASFKVCWDDSALYVFADVGDATPLLNAAHGDYLWNADALEVFISPDVKPSASGGLRFTDRHFVFAARPAAGEFILRNAPSGAPADGVRVATLPRADGAGYSIEAALPWRVIGFEPAMDAECSFDMAVDEGSAPLRRDRQFMWNGARHNSTSSDAWGRLRLVQ